MGSITSTSDFTITNKTSEEINNILSNVNSNVNIKKLFIINCENNGNFEYFFHNITIYLQQLEELYIENVKINKPELLNLKNLIKLKKITIKKCELNNIDEMDFYDLQQIKTIDLSFNLIKNVPEKLFRLMNVDDLNLSQNKISVLPENPQNFKFFSFNISYNELKYLPCWISYMLFHIKRYIISYAGQINFLFAYEGNPFITYVPIHIHRFINQLKYKQKTNNDYDNYNLLDVINICLERNEITKKETIQYIENNTQFTNIVKQNLLSYIDNIKTYNDLINSDELIKGLMGIVKNNEKLINQINFWFTYSSIYSYDIDLINVLNFIFLFTNQYQYETTNNNKFAVEFIERLNKTNFFSENNIIINTSSSNFIYNIVFP